MDLGPLERSLAQTTLAPYIVKAMAMIDLPQARIGIDLGGTKISGVVLARDGSELARHRVASPQGDYRATIEALTGMVQVLLDAVAMPAS